MTLWHWDKNLMRNIENRITELVARQLDLPPLVVLPDLHFVRDLGADSLDPIELILTLEEEFGVVIPHSDAESFSCVSSIVSYLEEAVSTPKL